MKNPKVGGGSVVVVVGGTVVVVVGGTVVVGADVVEGAAEVVVVATTVVVVMRTDSSSPHAAMTKARAKPATNSLRAITPSATLILPTGRRRQEAASIRHRLAGVEAGAGISSHGL
jgi:hypothetical protein